MLPLTVAGNHVYGLHISAGNGYRNDATSGIATNGAAEGAYMVASGQHVNNQCCFDYGNAETNNLDTGAGHMDAVFLGSVCNGAPCNGIVPGTGPWAGVDIENGIVFGAGNTSTTYSCVTDMIKNDGQTKYSLKVGNATTGGLTTWANDTPLPSGYSPMHQEGAIVLGVGGDNSNGDVGTFLEGAMTSGYPTNATENSVQSNIVAAGYTTCDNPFTTVVPTSQTTAQSRKYTTSTPPSGWQNTGFNDNGWSTGNGGFGASGTPGVVIGTNWTCSNCDIWMRRHFNPGSLTTSQRQNLVFSLIHDDDVSEIDINGVLGGVLPGYTGAYTYMSMTQAAKNAVVANGDNVLAVHIHQGTGGQSADIGISYYTASGGGPTPAPATSTPIGGPPSNGQILYWPFDAGSGTTATDYSGQGNTGTLVNGTTWTASGKSDHALVFNGTNNYVDANKNVVTTSGDFSVSVWVKLNSLTGWQTFVSQDGVNVSAFYLQYSQALGTKFDIATHNSDSTSATVYQAVSTTTPTTGTWYHLVGVQSGNNILLYVNGALQRTLATTGRWNSSGHTVVGRAFWSGAPADWVNGTIDQVRIYNRALSASEVTAIYNSGT